MYSQELTDRLIGLLAPDGYTPRAESEAAYPARSLPDGAEVMRVPPSPTGFVHIGTIYAGLVNERIAHQSGGVFILRIEDTDKKREVAGSIDRIIQAFEAFDLKYDEGPNTGGTYGPYLQSERAKIYLGYAIDLLQKGRAYPCFATAEELQNSIRDQQAKKQRPGYYGPWALWRDKSEDEINEALDGDKPFVLRFRSEGSHERRITYTDVFKGKMEVPENDLDVPLIKSDESRLPTYHLAHVVDDTLMRITKVFRSDEWLPSTALHIELCQALGLQPFTYGHFAPISIVGVEGGKRKLSKRKDPEADVQNWLVKQYMNPQAEVWVDHWPIPAVKAYLLGLADSSFEDWYQANPDKPIEDFKISLDKLAKSRAPLLDFKKLESYCRDHFARLPQDEFNRQVIEHIQGDARLQDALVADADYTNKVLSIERGGDKPRKDMASWSDAADLYGYFFDDLFNDRFAPDISEQLQDLDPAVITQACQNFLASFDPSDTQEAWLEKMRAGAEQTGLNLRDYARILRVKLTGKNRTPDLYTIMQVLGPERVRTRTIC